MHTSSKRALGWSSKEHRTLIPGPLWGQRRSSPQHLDSLEGAKHCLIHGMLILSPHMLSVCCSEMHHHYEVDINTASASLSICFYLGPSLKTSMGKVVSLSAPSLLRNHGAQVRRPCCGTEVTEQFIMLMSTVTFVLVKNYFFSSFTCWHTSSEVPESDTVRTPLALPFMSEQISVLLSMHQNQTQASATLSVRVNVLLALPPVSRSVGSVTVHFRGADGMTAASTHTGLSSSPTE